jgi:hypothetical protein
MASAKSFFNLAFSLSSPFSLLALEISSPPYLMGWSAPSDRQLFWHNEVAKEESHERRYDRH